jgi:hypothetical protein
VGANLSYIREHLPHFEALMVDRPDDLLDWGDVIVVTSADGGSGKALADRVNDKTIIDLGGLFPPAADLPDYHGIAW